MKKRIKIKANSSELILKVEASAAVASAGIANGRNVPVVFVKSDENNRINNIISMHKTIKEGNCECSWGVTNDNKNAVLILDFKNPIEQKIVLLFDIIKFGVVVNQILYAQCLWLMVGDECSKFSLCFDQERIFIEVPTGTFVTYWNEIFRNTYAKYLKKAHNLPTKTAFEVFDKMIKEFELIKTIRI